MILQQRALRLIYFCKSKEHTVPSFLESNYLPLPSLFFRDCSYLLYDINRQTAPVSILNQFVKTSQIHNYRTRSVSSDSFYVKLSRTDKIYAFFSRIGAQIWNSIPYSIKLLKLSSFRKKIKVLLLNFLRSEDDYVEVSRLTLFNTSGQPLFVILTWYLFYFMLVYSIYWIEVSSLLFSPSIDKPCTCKMSQISPPRLGGGGGGRGE